MSTSPPATGSPTAAKPRSLAEKILVRGFITVGLVLILIEFMSYWAQHSAYEQLAAKFKLTEEGGPPVKAADVKAAVGGRAPSTDEDLAGKGMANSAKRVEVYSWFTLSPVNKRNLYVYYGHEKDDPDVIGVGMVPEQTVAEKYPPKTEAEIEEDKRKAEAAAKDAGSNPSGPPGGMPINPGAADPNRPPVAPSGVGPSGTPDAQEKPKADDDDSPQESNDAKESDQPESDHAEPAAEPQDNDMPQTPDDAPPSENGAEPPAEEKSE
ncbi:MAG: hypothetical protein ACKV0T_01315 [Planctomycetales bacterium]